MNNQLDSSLFKNCSRNNPLVSIIIPAYNAERFITKTLESVLAQTYQNIEVMVIDDGSQDGTAAIVETYQKTDHRVHLLQQKNAGVAAARNLGIEQSSGEFIAPVDADDIFYPKHIEQQLGIFLESPSSVGLVYSWSVDIDEVNVPTGGLRAAKIEGNVYKTLICHNFIGNASASMIRRSCLDLVGDYNPEFHSKKAQGCEDWDLFLRIAEQFEFRAAPEFSVGYRKLLNSMSRDYLQMARSHALLMERVRQRYPELPNFLFRLSASSLYFYFAHQSHWGQNHCTTLFWLRQAVQSDPLTCWIRLGLYTLALKSLWGWGKSRVWVAPSPAIQTSLATPLTVSQIAGRKWKVALTLGIGNRFHQIITWLARQPMHIPPSLALESEGNTR